MTLIDSISVVGGRQGSWSEQKGLKSTKTERVWSENISEKGNVTMSLTNEEE